MPAPQTIHFLVDAATRGLLESMAAQKPGVTLRYWTNADGLFAAAAQEPGTIVVHAAALGPQAAEVVRQIRGAAWGKTVPILALVDGLDPFMRNGMLQAGATDALLLPATQADLADALARVAGIVSRRSRRVLADLPAKIVHQGRTFEVRTSDLCVEACKVKGSGLPTAADGMYSVELALPGRALTVWGRTLRTDPATAVVMFTALTPDETEVLKRAVDALADNLPPPVEAPRPPSLQLVTGALPPECKAFADTAERPEMLPPAARAILVPSDTQAITGDDDLLKLGVGAKLLMAAAEAALHEAPGPQAVEWASHAAKDASQLLAAFGLRAGEAMVKGSPEEVAAFRAIYAPLQRSYGSLHSSVQKASGLSLSLDPIAKEPPAAGRSAEAILRAARAAQQAPESARPGAMSMRPGGWEEPAAGGGRKVVMVVLLVIFAGSVVMTILDNRKSLGFQLETFPEMAYIDFDHVKVQGGRFVAPVTEYWARLPPTEQHAVGRRIAEALTKQGYGEGELTEQGNLRVSWPAILSEPAAPAPPAPVPPR